jgi:hypothetical protein
MRHDVRQSADGSAEPQLGAIEEVPSAGTTRFSSRGAIPHVAPIGTAAPSASERAFGPTTTLPPDLANKEPGLLWQRQDAGSGVVSETKNSADTSKKDRRPEPERRAEQSDNATYHAMNSQLKLLAYELHAAGTRLTFDLALANAAKTPDKARIQETDARLMVTIHRLDDMARETAKQISDLNTAKSEPRLAEGGQTLVAALEEFQPVMTEVEAWMTAHDVDTPSWEVVGRSNGIIKLIFPGIAPAAKPLDQRREVFRLHEGLQYQRASRCGHRCSEVREERKSLSRGSRHHACEGDRRAAGESPQSCRRTRAAHQEAHQPRRSDPRR